MNRQITSAFNFLRHSEYHICSWRLFSGIVTFVKNKIKHLSKKVTVCFCSFWSEICSVVSNSLWPHELYSPWHSPGQNTEVGSLSLLQGIFPTQGSNPGLLHCRWVLYQLSHKGSFSFRLENFFFNCQGLKSYFMYSMWSKLFKTICKPWLNRKKSRYFTSIIPNFLRTSCTNGEI